MPRVVGYIERVVYHNTENGYTVLAIVNDGEEYILVGSFGDIDLGEWIEAETFTKFHPTYGEQYNVISYEIKAPEDLKSIERYLASGAIKGVKEALAKRIIKKFKADTLRIMEEEPEQLIAIKGISERIAMRIHEQIVEKKEMRDAMIFLQKYGISMKLAVKIYKQYGLKLYTIIQQNPYQLAEDITGVGFKIADDIARNIGIAVDSVFRIKSGMIYILEQAMLSGHMYLPRVELLQQANLLLGIDEEVLMDLLPEMQLERRIVIKANADEYNVYINWMYYMELMVAKSLHDLNIHSKEEKSEIIKMILKIEKEQGIVLDEKQREAVLEVARSGLVIITGGPGTGKTTTINTIIQYFSEKHMEILLAAPTGRAAKRMTEATGMEAKTIHRLLEVNGMPTEERTGELTGLQFGRDEENPLTADVIIIDEMSMVDMYLIYCLLKAVVQGTRLVLVGDTNQLPSVGPGNVLRDIIDSKKFRVVYLDNIYRQAAQSDIVVNAHKMIHAQNINLQKKSLDFLFVKREEPDAIISAILTLVQFKLPNYVKADPYEIQVMSPMRKGLLGVERLNSILQSYLNPVSEYKKEKEYGSVIYRVGDKIMQIKNNYQINWEIRDKEGFGLSKGQGIYNGDIGIIREINEFGEYMLIEFEDGRYTEYPFENISELEHAFAITIHKSQGSEYPAVVIPMYTGPKLLMTRNLIYTAVTRARKCVTLVGMPECFETMVKNNIEMKRYSGLKDRIEELVLEE